MTQSTFTKYCGKSYTTRLFVLNLVRCKLSQQLMTYVWLIFLRHLRRANKPGRFVSAGCLLLEFILFLDELSVKVATQNYLCCVSSLTLNMLFRANTKFFSF